jgi:two-component system cell cycle sensor histidine kinase/response regulator CckA
MTLREISMDSSFRPLKILLVDDDPLIRMSLADLLQDMGHQTHEISHPGAALAYIAEEHPIDVLLTDVKLPSIDGYELAHRARNLRPELHVIFATGYSSDKARAASHDPLAHFLPKPFSKKELDKVLQSMGFSSAEQN